MRGVWLGAGSIALLVVAYVADRWLLEISINIGTYAGGNGWQELGLATSLLIRLLLLVGLVAIFMTLRDGRTTSGSWAVVGIGALLGLVPPLMVGLHIAMQPNGLPFVFLNTETTPLWSGTGVFLLWTGIGLLVLGVAGLLAARGNLRGASVPPMGLAIGAAVLVVLAYPIDELFQASAIELASGFEAYPAFLLVSLTMRIGVMVGFVVLLSSLLERAPSLTGGAALLVVGIVGFLVLPMVGLLATPFPRPGDESLAAALDPGTAGRWMAGASLVVGAFELWRSRREPASAPGPSATIAPDAEPA